MPAKLIRYVNGSIGGLLVAIAAALFLSSRVDAQIVWPHDPWFAVSTRLIFWVVAGICLVAALVSLWNEPKIFRALAVAVLVTMLAAYRVGCLLHGSHGLAGYLGSFSDAFGISAATAGTLAEAALGWLVLGSYFVLTGLWWQKRRNANDDGLKMICAACGGHIKFARQNLGRQIPCPHCQAALTLRKADNLKMACFFCQEHIEFPAHAVGEKLKCPHCKMDITLKEPA